MTASKRRVLSSVYSRHLASVTPEGCYVAQQVAASWSCSPWNQSIPIVAFRISIGCNRFPETGCQPLLPPEAFALVSVLAEGTLVSACNVRLGQLAVPSWATPLFPAGIVCFRCGSCRHRGWWRSRRARRVLSRAHRRLLVASWWQP